MRSFIFRLTMIFSVLLILFGILLAMTPALMSTDWGRKQTIKWMNHFIPGQIEIRSLNLSWTQGQVIEGILLKDPEGQSVIGIEKISTEASLWRIISRSTQLGFTQIEELNAAIVTDERGLTNIQRALGVEPSADTPRLSPSTIILSDVNADLHLFKDQKPLSAWIKGLTRQENLAGSFEINLALHGLFGSDWKKLREDAQDYLSIEGSKEAQLQVRVVNFPVDLIDRLSALKNPSLNGFFHSLLGDRLDLTIDKESDIDGLAFNLTALSPLMQGDIKGKIVKGLLQLQEPAVLHFNLTPESIHPFTHYHFELLNLSQIKVNISHLSLPLSFLNDKSVIDPCLFGFKADILIPETGIDIYSLGPINILNLEAHLDSPLCDSQIYLTIDGQAQHNKEPFEVHSKSNFKKPQTFSHLIEQIQQNFQSSLNVSHFPLQLVPFLHENLHLREQIGSYLNLQLSSHAINKEEWEAHIHLQTDRLVLTESKFHLGKDIHLIAPSELNWTMSPDCFEHLTQIKNISLDQPCLVQLMIKQLRLPLDSFETNKSLVEFTLNELKIPHLLSWAIIYVKDLNLKIEGQKAQQFSSSLQGQLALLTPDGHFSPFLDSPIELNQTAIWKIDADRNIEMPSGQLKMSHPMAHIQMKGYLTPDHHFTFTHPAQFYYALTPQAFQALEQQMGKEWPQLQETAHINLTVEPTSFAWKASFLASMKAKGLLTIDHISFKDNSNALPFVEELVLPWSIDGSINTATANLNGLAYAHQEVKPSDLFARLQIDHWLKEGVYDPSQAKLEMLLNLNSLPTSVLSVISNIDDLSPLLGPILAVDLKTFIDLEKQLPGYWDLSLDSSNFHIRTRFKFEDAITLYEADKPAELRLTITPESYEYLKTLWKIKKEQRLAAPVTLMGYLSQLYLPTKDNWIHGSQFDTHFSTNDIQWQDISLPFKLKGHFNSQDMSEHINFSLQATTTVSPLTIQGTIQHLFDAIGNLRPWQEYGLQAKIEGHQLTPAFVKNLLFLNQDTQAKIEALFGKSIELQANCQLQQLSGPLQASIIGKQGQITLNGNLTQGVLTLNAPLQGSVQVTPLLNQVFLARAVPMLSTAMDSEYPLRITIDPTQFKCPLIPFALNETVISQGTIDLGKIRFRNEGELSSILNLIHPISDQYLTIWFTPLYFQMNQGILNLKRLDMLVANNYTLASWGNINLNTHQGQFVLGISSQALQYAFGIQGMDKDYLLQVPFSSSAEKVDIDKKKLTARVTSLIAQTKGGSQGKLIGNLVDLALSNQGEIAPPPTTTPFPWEKEFDQISPIKTPTPSDSASSPPEKETHEKKKKKKHQDKHFDTNDVIKGLEDGAKQVLDHFFGQ